jgi:hypothetical protein
MGRTACTEPQCLYKGALYLTFYLSDSRQRKVVGSCVHGIEHSDFIKMSEISSLTDEIVGSLKAICSMELASGWLISYFL